MKKGCHKNGDLSHVCMKSLKSAHFRKIVFFRKCVIIEIRDSSKTIVPCLILMQKSHDDVNNMNCVLSTIHKYIFTKSKHSLYF